MQPPLPCSLTTSRALLKSQCLQEQRNYTFFYQAPFCSVDATEKLKLSQEASPWPPSPQNRSSCGSRLSERPAGSVQGKGTAPLLTPLQGNISPAGAGHRQKAQETHQAWYVGTKCKHLSLSAFSRQNTARCTCVGWSVVAPRSSLWSVMSNCALWCWHLPEQRTQLIISAKDVLPIPLGKQIFVLSEAIPLLLLQNYQLWPLKPCHKGMNYLYFFLFFLNKGSNYPP